MIKIIIADDHQMFIDGLKSILETNAQYQIVGEANNGIEVIELLSSSPADIILMDVNMPKMDGIETTKQVVSRYPTVKVVMLTMHNTRDYIEKLLRAGAHGYVLKNTGKVELFEAIETVMRGESFFSKEVTERIMEGLQKKKPSNSTLSVELTEREKEVIKLISQECTTQEIADKLFISTHTVETHRKNLLSKLGVKNVAGLVVYAYKEGLIE